MASPSSGRTFTGERIDEDVNFPARLKAPRAVFRFGWERPEFIILPLAALSRLDTCLEPLEALVSSFATQRQ